MNLFKNKHMILAMFISPILAVIAYFAVDYVVSEKPHAAVEGASYKLVPKSNCRYKSGVCTLHNGDIEVDIKLEIVNGAQTKVFISSDFPIQNAIMSFVNDVGYEKFIAEPVSLSSIDKRKEGKSNNFFALINAVPTEESLLRLAVQISSVMYYAETTTVFIDLETSFSRENFFNK